jgi:DnaJ-domain-containing protein 1
MTIFDRLKNISKAYFNHQFRRKSSDSPSESDEKAEETASGEESQSSGSAYSSSASPGTKTTSNPYGLPQQVVDDLALFGIPLPGSWDEVIKARNREMKKYHPDKYMSKEEKVDAANEIAQIYNAAFERLEKFYDD